MKYILCVTAAVQLLSISFSTHMLHASAVYPGKTWETATPESVGLDEAKLNQLKQYIGGRGCVVRHGRMVYTWGEHTRRGDVASAAKSLYSHFLFKALELGKIPSLNQKVSVWEPRLKKINPELGYKDRDITWRHMANQISCYGLTHKPGTAFAYNDWQMALFFDTLFLKVYGATWDNVDRKVLHPLLTDSIQCQDNPTFMAFGTGDRPGRLAISPRDFARFGLLYLNEGNWNGKRLLDKELAIQAVSSPLPNSLPRAMGEAADMINGQRSIGSRRIPDSQCDHIGSYSWLWWLNGIDREGHRHWPDVPPEAYGAFGHGGPRAMVVIPTLDLIISWNDTKVKSREAENKALGLLVSSVQDIPPRAGQIIVDPDHPEWLKRYEQGAFFMCGPGDPEGFLYRGDENPDGTRDGDQMELIRKMKDTGANCIYMMAARSHGGDGEPSHNPFLDHDPKKGINYQILAQWDRWFTAMDEAGIVIFFIFYDDSTNVWDTGDKVSEGEKQFLQKLVKRFRCYNNLIWCIAEEYQEALTPKRATRIAAIIREADPYRHPIGIHKLTGLDFSEFADDPNIDQFTIQYNVDNPQELHEGMVKAWKDAAGRYNLNMSEAADHGTGKTARLKNWASAMGGAYVMLLEMDIASTSKSDMLDCGRLVSFFESTDFYRMAPHDALRFADTEYVLALPGESYIAYTSKASEGIGLKNMAEGLYKFTWVDCATGRIWSKEHVRVESGTQEWKIPAGFGNEIAVYISKEGTTDK